MTNFEKCLLFLVVRLAYVVYWSTKKDSIAYNHLREMDDTLQEAYKKS